jgi:hypothetical protein
MSIDGDKKHSKAPFSTPKIRSAPSTAPFKTNPPIKRVPYAFAVKVIGNGVWNCHRPLQNLSITPYLSINIIKAMLTATNTAAHTADTPQLLPSIT